MNARVKPLTLLVLIASISTVGVAYPQISSWNGQGVPPGSTQSTTSGSCSAVVQSQIAQQQQQYIAGAAANAAGTFPYLPGGSFLQNSCLSNLLGGNLSLFFGPPSLSSLLSDLANQACSMVSSVEQQAIAPLAQGIQQGLPSYEIAPGVTTGALTGGLYINPIVGNGQQPGPPVSVNITPMFDSGNSGNQSYFNNGLIGVNQ